jgi:hypothetical protein
MDAWVILVLLCGAVLVVVVRADRRASDEARRRAQPIRRPGERFTLPSADETRLTVARFRRAVAEWAMVEHKAEQLQKRRDALRRPQPPS